MKDTLSRAYDLVNEVVSQPNGEDVLYAATILHSLRRCEADIPLSREEMLTLADRLVNAAGMSTIPLLTAERADAVRYLLEYGITENMSPEFTALPAQETRTFLLSCDMEIFINLVDAVAVDSQAYYAPDYGAIDAPLFSRVNDAIQTAFPALKRERSDLAHMLSSAAKKEQAQDLPSSPPVDIPLDRS